MSRAWAAVCFATILAACGGGTLTVSEYAAEVEQLVAEMEAEFATKHPAAERFMREVIDALVHMGI